MFSDSVARLERVVGAVPSPAPHDTYNIREPHASGHRGGRALSDAAPLEAAAELGAHVAALQAEVCVLLLNIGTWRRCRQRCVSYWGGFG